MAAAAPFVLCSPYEGRLVDEVGSPVPGVTVTRRWTWGWNSETGEDVATTGPDGSFSFGSVTGSSFTARFMPHEPLIDQAVSAKGPDGDVLLSLIKKRGYEMGDELRDSPHEGRGIKVVCRIDKEPDVGGFFFGTCVYDE